MKPPRRLTLAAAALSLLAACGGSSSDELAAPTDLTATANSDGSITLNWSAVAADGYLIERGTAAGGESTATIASVASGGASSYSDGAGLVAGDTYFYQVIATEGGEANSAPSAEVHATALAPTENCADACNRIVACGSGGHTYGAGFGYSGDTFYGSASYGAGYGAYGYSGELTLNECTSDCAAAAADDQQRIVACIFASSTCGAELSCE